MYDIEDRTYIDRLKLVSDCKKHVRNISCKLQIEELPVETC